MSPMDSKKRVDENLLVTQHHSLSFLKLSSRNVDASGDVGYVLIQGHIKYFVRLSSQGEFWPMYDIL